MPKYRQEITPRQERFVQEYIGNGYNATQAALKAYSQKYSSARVTACRLLTKDNIQMAITAHLYSNGIPLDLATKQLAELLQSEDQKIVLGALNIYYRIIGAYAPQKSHSVARRVSLEDLIEQQKKQ
ncbi:MAG TPA: terminase small subunit [Candidatus Andersenbacteria bacterium]|nr:terminase small subunit [Candidatus Andersenbacteria bacterium]